MPVTNSLAGYCGPALVETYLELWQNLTSAAQRAALAPQRAQARLGAAQAFGMREHPLGKDRGDVLGGRRRGAPGARRVRVEGSVEARGGVVARDGDDGAVRAHRGGLDDAAKARLQEAMRAAARQ